MHCSKVAAHTTTTSLGNTDLYCGQRVFAIKNTHKEEGIQQPRGHTADIPWKRATNNLYSSFCGGHVQFLQGAVK